MGAPSLSLWGLADTTSQAHRDHTPSFAHSPSSLGLKGTNFFIDLLVSRPKAVTATGLSKLSAFMSPNNDRMQLHSLISCLSMKLDPINTTLGDIAGVGKVDLPVRSKCVLIGEVLESGEVNAGSVGQVLSVNAKRSVEQWTKGAGLAFIMIRFGMTFAFTFAST